MEEKRTYKTRKLRTEPTEEHLWEVVLLYQKVKFKTYSGLPFSYEIRKGRNGQYTKELWIDRPKSLGDIRGVTYIYGMFYRFGLIDVPERVKEVLNGKKKYKNLQG